MQTIQNQRQQLHAAEEALKTAITVVEDAQASCYHTPAGVEVNLKVEKAYKRLIEAHTALRKIIRTCEREAS